MFKRNIFKIKSRTFFCFDMFALLYLSSSSLLCNMLNLIDIAKLFLSLPSFLLIPYLLGKTLFRILSAHYLLRSPDEGGKQAG